MTMQFKDTYREWNEKVRPSEELLSRLLTEASKVTEASEISAAEESAKRHKKWNDKVQENKIQGKPMEQRDCLGSRISACHKRKSPGAGRNLSNSL